MSENRDRHSLCDKTQEQRLLQVSIRVLLTHTLLVLGVTTGCQSGWLQSGRPSRSLSLDQRVDMQLAFGQAAEQRGDQDAAIAAYRNTLNKDPSSVAAMHGLAIALDKNGKNKKATQLYLEALELAPENAMVHADLGYSLSLQRDLQGAEFHLKKALELNPEIVQARNNLALVLARSGRFDEALRAFEANGLSESQARSNLAAMMLMEGEVDLASAEITRAKQAHIYGPPPEILHRVAALVERAQTEARPRLTGDGVRR